MTEHGAQHEYAGRSVGGGRYQLLRLLGEGGMASVHLAHDSVLDRQVAIKTLHSELGREASFRERFRREALAVARLSHPNVVSVFDTGEDTVDGAKVPFIVMEYVEGQPLRNVLDSDVAQYGAMPTEKALRITAEVLAALDASHEMGLVHRDIKPGNVMMTKRGVVKVMDFGIARAVESGVSSMTQTGMVVGTPQYLSPEQALGRGVDARSDLYSVGVMLFELLTGRLPFDADNPLAIAYAHVQEAPAAPSTINRAVPQYVDSLVARSLAKNPNDRYSSAELMREEARRAAGMTPPGAAPAVIPGQAQHESGAGVGQAVFPPVNPASSYQSPPPGAPSPYQPLGHYGGFGPSSPSTPPPTPGYATPPPYQMSPVAPTLTPSGGGGNKNLVLIVSSAIVAIAAVAAIIIVIALSGGNGGKNPDAKGSETPTTKTDEPTDDGEKEFKAADKSRVIDETECTEAREHYDDKSKKSMPDLTYKDIDSVKKCLDAAGWKYEIADPPKDSLWEKDTVLDQSPNSGDALDAKKDKIELSIASGYPE